MKELGGPEKKIKGFPCILNIFQFPISSSNHYLVMCYLFVGYKNFLYKLIIFY